MRKMPFSVSSLKKFPISNKGCELKKRKDETTPKKIKIKSEVGKIRCG